MAENQQEGNSPEIQIEEISETEKIEDVLAQDEISEITKPEQTTAELGTEYLSEETSKSTKFKNAAAVLGATGLFLATTVGASMGMAAIARSFSDIPTQEQSIAQQAEYRAQERNYVEPTEEITPEKKPNSGDEALVILLGAPLLAGGMYVMIFHPAQHAMRSNDNIRQRQIEEEVARQLARKKEEEDSVYDYESGENDEN
jgi:hypothetical protein